MCDQNASCLAENNFLVKDKKLFRTYLNDRIEQKVKSCQ